MELIQYEPQTETVFETPLLLSPPWINRYYIMDLAPGRSFVEWAVAARAHRLRHQLPQPRRVDARRRPRRLPAAGLDHRRGRRAARSPAPSDVNVAGSCVGGTLAVMLDGLPGPDGRRRSIRSPTLLNTLIDFSEPGPLGAFTDAAAVDAHGAADGRAGLSGRGRDGRPRSTPSAPTTSSGTTWPAAGSWASLRRRSTSWRGTADSTRISEATHSFYLRACYLENRLAQGNELAWPGLTSTGVCSTDPTSWPARRTTSRPGSRPTPPRVCFPARSRFVLSSSGHIAGIVNPPSNKRQYWTNDDLPERPRRVVRRGGRSTPARGGVTGPAGSRQAASAGRPGARKRRPSRDRDAPAT